MSEHTMAEAIDGAMEQLQRAPLVWIEDGFFIVRDEKLPGFRYDFECRDAKQALHWIAHLAEKQWVTTEHLRQFAVLVSEQPQGKRR